MTDITRVTLERGGCFGSCPIFDVTFKADNSLLYLGYAYVDKIGVYAGQTDFKRIAAWLTSESIEHFDDKYSPDTLDAPTLILTVVARNGIKIIKSQNATELPPRVSGVVAALEGFASQARLRPVSPLDSFLGYYVDDRKSDELILSAFLLQDQRSAYGFLDRIRPDVRCPDGLTETSLQLDPTLRDGSLAVSGYRMDREGSRRSGRSIPLRFEIATNRLIEAGGPLVLTRVSRRQFVESYENFLKHKGRPNGLGSDSCPSSDSLGDPMF